MRDLVERSLSIHERIADAVPQIKRGRVWCRTCGRDQSVDGANALRFGWPRCCGFTMTIDSPDEQVALRASQTEEPRDA